MISSRVAVAVHILAYLAWRRDEPSTSEKIAGSVNTNPVVVRRIMGSLRDAGLVQGQPGAGGGSMLVRDPAEITLLDVYRAVEDGEDLFALHADPCQHCGIGSNIRQVLQGVFCRAHDAMQGVLGEVTIADVFSALEGCAARVSRCGTSRTQRCNRICNSCGYETEDPTMNEGGRMLALLTMLLTAFAATAVEAQSARLLGRVTDVSGRPLRDAAVVLEPEGAPGPRVTTASGASGGYQFTGVPPGMYRVSTGRAGYRGDALRVRVKEGLVLVPVIRLPVGRAESGGSVPPR